MPDEEEKNLGDAPEVEKTDEKSELEKAFEPDQPEESEKSEKHKDKPDKSGSGLQRLKHWYATHKKWSIPLTVLLLLGIVTGVPWTRYQAAGVALKKDFSLQVLDSSANTPVSDAKVTVGSASGTTNGEGKVVLHGVKVGERTALVSKKYYKDEETKIVVPILKQKGIAKIKVEAIGRQVKVIVSNLINKEKLGDVQIKAGAVEAKTDKSGEAVMVLPVGTTSQKATLTLKGYNNLEVTIAVSDKEIKENSFSLTPEGKIYFLSKQSGKIDVVKSNLDGTDRKTVLAGTGKEEDRGTVLLASRDWKYLALLSRRDSAQAKLYLIETSSDHLTVMDEGDASFTPVGWNDNYFVYTADRLNVQSWEPNEAALKSYNASTKRVSTLDQTAGEGTSSSNYASENYGQIYLIGKNAVFHKNWSGYSTTNPGILNNKSASIYSVLISGGTPVALKSFGHEPYKTTYLYSVPYETKQIYYEVTEKGVTSYHAYDGGKIVPKDKDLVDEFSKYNQNPITYLQSPSGDETFWVESRDGKSTLFIGDQDGENGKQVATLSEYLNYGWFSDKYLLVSKKGSELYIIARAGLKEDKEALKISDYHKPTQSFPSYGGGYGGI